MSVIERSAGLRRIKPNQKTVLAICLWLVTRSILLWFATRPENQAWDIDVYRSWLGSFGHWSFPVDDQTFQYPPLSMFVFVPLALFGNSYQLGFVLMALLVDAAIMAIVLSYALKNQQGRFLGVFFWAGVAALVGPILYQRYDLFPAIFAVAGLAIFVSRPRTSTLLSALGFMVKVWPALLLFAYPRKQLPKLMLVFAGTCLASWALIALFFSHSSDFLLNLGGRGLQIESVAALPFLFAKASGGDVTFVSANGCWEVLGSISTFTASVVTIAGFCLLLVLLLLRSLGLLECAFGADVVITAILIFIISGKVNSPQYMIWAIAVIAIALADVRSRVAKPAILVAISTACAALLVETPLYGLLLEGNIFATVLQAIRVLTLLAATVWAAFIVLTSPKSSLCDSGAAQ